MAADGGGVGTAGRIEALPGALNVVPERARLWVEFRNMDMDWLDSRRVLLDKAAGEAGGRRGVTVEIKTLTRTEPVVASDLVRKAMANAVAGLGLESKSLPSGAGHDAGHMAKLGPVGMLFVPSVGGRSHCPEEWTAPEHLKAGATALLATLWVLDAQ